MKKILLIIIAILSLGNISSADFSIDSDELIILPTKITLPRLSVSPVYFPSNNIKTDLHSEKTLDDDYTFSDVATPMTGFKKFGKHGYYDLLYPDIKFDLVKFNKNHKTLFLKIYDEINAKKELDSYTPNDPKNSTDSLLKHIHQETLLEVKVAKFRYQDDAQANKDEKDIREKLSSLLTHNTDEKINILEQNYENTSGSVCGVNLSGNLNIKTAIINSKKIEDISSYYVFGINRQSYKNKNIGSNQVVLDYDDLQKIDTSEYLLMEVSPEVFYYNGNIEGLQKVESDGYLTQIYVNIEHATLIDYFQKNNKDFAKNDLGSHLLNNHHPKYTFMLLGINSEKQVKVIAYNRNSLEIDITPKHPISLNAACIGYHQKSLYKEKNAVNTRIGSYFSRLDKKYHFQELDQFLDKIYSSDYERSIVDDKRDFQSQIGIYKNGYIKYHTLLNKLSKEVLNIEKKINTHLTNTYKLPLEELLLEETQNKIEQLQFKKSIIENIKHAINIREQPLIAMQKL